MSKNVLTRGYIHPSQPWDRGPDAMDLTSGLFAQYSLVERP